MSEKLKQFMKAASPQELELMAMDSDTSVKYLYLLASGERKAGAELAGKIETSAKKLRKGSKGRLPKLLRGDMSPGCANCPYHPKCKV